MKRQSLLSSSMSMLLMLSCTTILAGCDSLPSGGPRSGAYESAKTRYVPPTEGAEAEASKLPFALVDVDRKVLEALLSAEDSNYFQGAFTDRTPPAAAPLGVGDVLRITIFEAGPGGLFVQNGANSNGNYVTLPDQEVDQTGHISVPYAGKNGESGIIEVNGKTPGEVQHDIQLRLLNKAIEPQVILTVVKRTSNMFSVIGDINAAGRFSLDQAGTRIMDALSVAGGPRSADYNTLVTLQRGTKSATARLSRILRQSDNNIFVQPGDLIAVKKDERYYNVLGAMRGNSRIAFEAETVTVADAIAKAGGLDQENAEPASVVIFRREDAKTLEAEGVSLEGFNTSESVPTVYRFDLTQATGVFLAQKMQLRGDDVLYVSKHPYTDVNKLMGIFRDIFLIHVINKN